MSRHFRPRKKTVEIQPAARVSRIRRDPPAQVEHKGVNPYPSEREVWIVVIGVILFALAISLITIGFSQITAH